MKKCLSKLYQSLQMFHQSNINLQNERSSNFNLSHDWLVFTILIVHRNIKCINKRDQFQCQFMVYLKNQTFHVVI